MRVLPPSGSLISSILPSKLQLSWRPQTLSIQEDHCALPGFALPTPQLGNALQAASQNNHRAHLICFPSLRDHSPLLHNVQNPGNNCFVYFVSPCSSSRWEGKYGPCYSFFTGNGSEDQLFCPFYSSLSLYIILRQLSDMVSFHCYIV